MTPAWIVPDWPAPPGVRAAASLRIGGVSPPPWHSLNIGDHVGDTPARVTENRLRLARALALPGEPAWLEQVHGREVLRLDAATVPAARTADAAVTGLPGRVLAVLTADCLPVLFCRGDGRRIGVAHAGWRGLADGVLEATVEALDAPPGEVLAWLGPGIGPAAYEVGADVRDACLAAGAPAGTGVGAGAVTGVATGVSASADIDVEACFTPGRPGRWQFDLAGLARRRLEALGLAGIHGGQWCTHADPVRFYSHRRDGAERPTGRMATLLWLDPPG